MAVPVTAVEPPARTVSPRHFVRLKLRVLGNNFRGQAWRIALFVLGVLFGLWFAGVGFFLLAAPGLAGESRYALMTAAFGGGVLTLGWLLLPLVFFGVDETLDPARFALLPLSRRTLVTGLLAAALVSVPALATTVTVAGLVVTAGALGGWSAALVGALGALGGLLVCVAGARAVTSAFATMLRSRRVRDLAAVLLAVLAALLGPLQLFVVAAVQQADWDRLTGVARVLGWTPFGAPWTAGVDVAEGRAGAAVVCTTARPEAVDPALRGPDLLALRITVPLPDPALRREQLTVLTRQVPLAGDVRLDEVAARTPGFVAADLAALVREAGVRAALRQKTAETPTVAMADFAAALEVVRPTTMAASTLELASVTLDDVGGLHEVRQTLTESVLWPLTYPDTFARLGVTPPRGVLLYGPPGCGKTYLVTALAGSGRANVLSVKGAELLSKWVGESERAVRELFRRAREAAPTLVFLDEVDALAPVRGQATDGGTTDRVVAALLTELDGVEALRNVVVVGATNRPELVDPALLRPGRLERLVYVPPPDGPARTEILRAAARNVPLAPDVDLDALGGDLDGFSAADCAALVREAALAAMRESLSARTVTAAHVEAARARVRPSLDPAQLAHLESYAASRR
nr:AAA family ATPase [Micromonospora maritima]